MSESQVDKNLEEIRREVIEGRNLIIKTDNLLKNLHAELKMVSKRQDDFQKRQWISSGVAYGAFVALCVAGALAISGARTSNAAADRERLEKQVAELQAGIDKQKTEAQAQAQASRAAADVYRLMTTLPGDERLKGVDALQKLDTTRLSLLEKKALEERSVALRNEIGQSAFERGKAAFRRNEMQNTVTELARFLAMNPAPQDAMDASFFLGAAYVHTRKYDEGIQLLTRFITGDRRSKSRDYAMMLLAQAYESTGQATKAMEVARDALGTYPNSEFGPQLRARLASAKRMLTASAENAAGAFPPTAGAPAAAPIPGAAPVVPAAAAPVRAPGTAPMAPVGTAPARVPAPTAGTPAR